MNNPPTPNSAQLQWDEQGQPYSTQFGDIYFSKEHGLNETRYVFLQHNQLPERFAQLEDYRVFTIAETGFGTGLNFLAAWQLWRQKAAPLARLHFVSVEKYPLTPAQLQQALLLWPELTELSQTLLNHYPYPAETPVNRLSFDNGRVQLTLIYDEATTGLAELGPTDNGIHNPAPGHYGATAIKVDAWFLDGFAPSKNPDMWQPALYQIMAKLSHSGTTLATFTAAGDVRRGLSHEGFSLQKTQGYGRKREMLSGHFSTAPHPPTHNPTLKKSRTPQEYWHLYPTSPAASASNKHTVAVIGAGLAGCHTARALAERGYSVTVYDAGTHIANGASGNPQGVVYTRFSHENNALAQLNMAALYFADSYYQHRHYGQVGARTGVYHQEHDTEQRQANQRTTAAKITAKYSQNTPLAQALTADDASKALDAPIEHPGVFTHLGGWMRPDALCQTLLNHPNIQVRLNHALVKLSYTPNSALWQLHFNQQACQQAKLVVVANAHAAKQLAQLAHLPIKGIRGQMSYATLNEPEHLALKAPICGEGYLAPTFTNALQQTQLCFGATFDVKSTSTAITPQDNTANLAMLQRLMPRFNLPVNVPIQGRASLRCSTPDYLPIIGPAPIEASFEETFGAYRKNKNYCINALGQYHLGLFVNVGHGSRGLVYTPYAAELIACLINGEPLPMAEAVYKHCHPARFIIRDLIRNKR